MSDEQLIENCLKKNPAAQRELYDRFASRLMGLMIRYAESTEQAQDMLQDGFIKIFENLHKYSGTGSIEGWMKKIAVNTALETLRKEKKLLFTVNIDDVGKLPEEQIIEGSHSAKDLLGLIRKLPEGYRTIFNMYAIEGFSHKEIGEILGISEGTSKSQYLRARLQLQKQLEAENNLAE
jgi:RNA polymerase sigma factor (sigma-70 family)